MDRSKCDSDDLGCVKMSDGYFFYYNDQL